MIGETIGQYRILSELGRGGMGVVYLAEDTKLNCRRALKFLPPSSLDNEEDRARFLTEARALAALEHPNICPVQGIEEINRQTFIVMSYIEGPSLAERLREGPLPVDEALEIAIQVAAGLEKAHGDGVAHRDIKPGNIQLPTQDSATKAVRPVVMDFGLAKINDTTFQTVTGTTLGTGAYMAPELARGEPADHHADLWALGVVLYEMLAGRPPFRGEYLAAVLYSVMNEDPQPLDEIVPDLPEGLAEVVGKALAKKRTDRYQSATEMLEDLRRVQAGSAVEAPRITRRRKGRPVALFLMAAFVALGVTSCALYLWPGFLARDGAITAVAVMPLEERGAVGDEVAFSEGVTDELVTKLSKVGSLTVVSRSSSARAKDLYDDNREIARRLGVGALIEGTVQRQDGRVRVSAQLVSARDDRLLWSDSFTRDVSDILNLQSEIAQAIVVALEAELTPQAEAALAKQRTVDPKAFEALQFARYYGARMTADDLQKAIEFNERALELDPDYAQAHVELAKRLVGLTQMAALAPDSLRRRIREHAERALQLDPDLPSVHEQLGSIALHELDLEAAGKHFRRMRELDPAGGSITYAQYLNAVGRHEDGLAEAQRAVASNPLNLFWRANLAGRYYYAGQVEEAYREFETVVAQDPDFWLPYWGYGLTDLLQGDAASAVTHLERAAELLVPATVVQPDLAYAYLLTGQEEKARAILEDFERRARSGYVAPFYLAVLYAAFDRSDEAFAALDEAWEERDPNLTWIRPGYQGYPALRNLQDDPRWDEFCKRIWPNDY